MENCGSHLCLIWPLSSLLPSYPGVEENIWHVSGADLAIWVWSWFEKSEPRLSVVFVACGTLYSLWEFVIGIVRLSIRF